MPAEVPLPRVLLLAPHFPPDSVAGAARLGSFARELGALGHEVRVVAPRIARGRGAFGNLAHQRAMRAALGAGGLQAIAQGFQPDVVLVSSPPPLAALAGIDVAAAAGARLAWDVRDIWPDVLIEAGAIHPWGLPAAMLRLVERRLLDAACLITTPTRAKIERLGSRTGALLRLVVNGVDEAWLGGAPPYAGGGGESFEILYAGNIGHAQDVALLARAVAGTPFRATIVGDGERRAEVGALAAAPGGAVRLLDPESREAIRARLASCGCAFVSLRSAELADAVPSKLLEALALGVPVIAAVAGEAAEILRESGGGLVVEPGDLAGLRAAMGMLASLCAAERIDIGARGREFVLGRFRREDAGSELSRALCELVGLRSNGSQA